MEQHEAEIAVPATKEARTYEDALKLLWDKVKAAADLIAGLREEKRTAHERLISANNEIEGLRSELQRKEQEMKRLRSELAQSMNSNGAFSLSSEEKEILRDKIRELIAKINSHL